MSFFPDNSSAAAMVATAWRNNGLAGDEAIDGIEEGLIPVPLLVARIIRLAPRMPSKDHEAFISAFTRVWPRIDAPGITESRYALNYGATPEDEMVLMRWIEAMAARRTPVASASRRLIKEGDKVAYPEEFAVMKILPSCYGDYRLTGFRDDYFRPIKLTHRQLAQHVEFAPLLAAVFLASRLPGSLINGMLIPSVGMRPRVTTLLEVLLSRRPDIMTDDQVLPYVSWLLRPRPPLWPDFEEHIVG
jgi:hypothetical protein